MPIVKRMFAVLMFICISICGLSVANADLDVSEAGNDENKTVRMENDYWRLTFLPQKGGVCSSLIYKPGNKELTCEGGIFSDYVAEQSMRQGDWAGKPYSYSVHKAPDQVSITMARAGTALRFVTIRKTVTLLNNSPVIRVDYEFANQREAMAPVTISPRYHNRLFLPEECNYYTASSNGIENFSYIYNSGKAQPDHWINEPVRSWGGFIGKTSNIGAVCIFPYPTIKSLYNWFGNTPPSQATIEYFSTPVTIDAGSAYNSTWYILPVEGLPGISEATTEMVCSLETKSVSEINKPLNFDLKVFSVIKDAANVIYRVKRLPDTKVDIIGKADLSLATAKLTGDSFGFIPRQEGTYVISAGITTKEGRVCEIERSVVIGKKSDVYKMQAREERVKLSREARFLPYVLKQDYITPHWKWSKPYVLPRISALFLMDIWSQREVIELSQRMDLDYTNATIMIKPNVWGLSWYPSDLWKKVAGEEVQKEGYKQAEQLLKKDYDVIVISAGRGSNKGFSALEWNRLTDNSHAEILKKVAAGTGLVVVQPQALALSGELEKAFKEAKASTVEDYVAKGIPFEILPQLRAAGETHAGGSAPVNIKDIKIGSIGKGRIVFLDYDTMALTPDVELEQTRYPYWEYYYSLLIKSLLYAGKREGAASIVSVKDVAYSAEKGSESALSIVLNGIQSSDKAVLTARIVSEDGDDEAELSETVGEDRDAYLLKLPCLKAGWHLITVTLLINGRISDFYTTVIEKNMDISADMVLLKNIIAKNEPIKGEIRLKSAKASSSNTMINLSLYDNYGRLTYNRSITAVKGCERYDFEIKASDHLTYIYTLRADIQSNGFTLATVKKEITCPGFKGFFSDAYGVMWADKEEPEHLTYYKYDLLSRLGLGAMDGWDRNFPVTSYLMSKANMPIFGHNNVYRICTSNEDIIENRASQIRKKNGKYQCLSDPEYRESVKRVVKRNIENATRYGTGFFNLADEPSHYWYDNPVDGCWCDLCQAGFREWLKKEYVTIDQLNRSWQASFNTWDEVRPSWEKEIDNKVDHYASWADFRNYMDEIYYDLNKSLRVIKDDISPDTMWGISGVESDKMLIFSGNRWDKISSIFDLHMAYATGDILRSFKSNAVTGLYNGYYADAFQMQYNHWLSMLRGDRIFPFWYSKNFLLPDFQISPEYGKPLNDLISEMTSGIGTMLSNSTRKTSPVAIYYSHASAQALYILKNKHQRDTLKIFGQNMMSYRDIIRDLGYQPTYISPADIEQEKLKSAGIKVLILPLSVSLTDKELTSIKDFVSTGGTVIADCLIGKMDEHINLRDKFPLDEVFGINSSRELKMNVGSSKGTVNMEGGVKNISLTFTGPKPDLVNGKAAGEVEFEKVKFGGMVFDPQPGINTPLFIFSSYGQGRAVYLNFLPLYESMNKADKEVVLSYFSGVFADAGVRRPITIFKANSKSEVGCEINEFTDGRISVFGLIMPVDWNSRSKETINSDIVFSRPGHLYDLREHKYLGDSGSIKTTLTPGIAKVFALLPYRFEGISITAKERNVKQGDALGYTINVNTSSKSQEDILVARIDVFQPDGQLSQPYSCKVRFSGNTYNGHLPIALNDSKGIWRVRVTEIISGMSDEKVVEVN